MTIPPTHKEVVRAASMAATLSLLEECSPRAQKFFHSIHENAPWKSFENCPDSKLDSCYELVRRTVIEMRQKTGE